MNNNENTSFFAKVLIFFREKREQINIKKLFSRIIERQKELSGYSGKESSDEAKISYLSGIFKVACAVLLVLALLFTVLFGSGIFSYENVYYMFKDIGYINSFNEASSDVFNYSAPIQNQAFAEFKNGLAVAADSEIKLFTSTGRMTLSLGSAYVNPKIATSAGNVLIYDQGRKYFSIYNSFVSLYSENLDFPISCADMAEDGGFAVATKSPKYASVIKIYSNRFKLRHEYSKNDNVVAVSMSDNGRYVVSLSLSTGGGDSIVSVDLIDCRREKAAKIFELNGVLPYSCDFLSDNRIMLLCNDRMCIFDRDGKLLSEYMYPSELSFSSVYNGRVALCFKDEENHGKSRITVFDSDGKVSFTAVSADAVKDMELGEGYIYVLYRDSIDRIETKFGIRVSSDLDGENASIVVFRDGDIAVCGERFARKITFD